MSFILVNIGGFGLEILIVDFVFLIVFWKFGGGWRGFIYGLDVVGRIIIVFLIGFFGVDFYLNGIVV